MSARQCRVYWASPDHALPRHRELFTATELERADAYRREIDRNRFTVGCALSRLALGELLDLPPASVPLLRDCADCGGQHGRPRLADESLHLSVSHSGDRVVVAVTGVGPVGVDVEHRSLSATDIAESVLTPAELSHWRAQPDRVASFFAYWTRKEAVLKATGDGLRAPMVTVRVSGSAEPARLLKFAKYPDLRLWLADMDAGEEHSAALAVVTGGHIEVDHVDGAGMLARS